MSTPQKLDRGHLPTRNRNSYRYILFDLDNTLVDTNSLKLRVLGTAGADLSRILVADLSCLSAGELVTKYAPHFSAEDMEREYLELLADSCTLHDPATGDCLEHLRLGGAALGLVTSSSEDVATLMLNRLGLAEFFSGCVVSFESCDRIKPNPDPIILAIQQLNGSALSTLYVGDAIQDLLASHEAGAFFALAGWSTSESAEWHSRADLILKKIGHLVDITSFRI
jgi:pyrophosphatase PpaX